MDVFPFSAFAVYLASLGLAERTRQLYLYRILRFAERVAERGYDLDTAEADVIASASEEETGPSRRQLRAALAHYWTWTGRNPAPFRAVRTPRKPRPRCRALPLDQVEKLVKASHLWHPEGTAVLLGLYLGLRAHEIAECRWDRFSDGFEWYRVDGKGEVVADLAVPRKLADHFATLERPPSIWVFPSPQRHREHVHPRTIWLWVRAVAHASGVGQVATHVLRHCAIASVHDGSGDLRLAQTFARHRDVESTTIYTRITNERLRDAADILDDLF